MLEKSLLEMMCWMLKWIVWGEGGLPSPGILTPVTCTSVREASGGTASGCCFSGSVQKGVDCFPWTGWPLAGPSITDCLSTLECKEDKYLICLIICFIHFCPAVLWCILFYRGTDKKAHCFPLLCKICPSIHETLLWFWCCSLLLSTPSPAVGQPPP